MSHDHRFWPARSAEGRSPDQPADRLSVRRARVLLACGCEAHVLRHAETLVTLARKIHRRSPQCRDVTHQLGARVYLWELLPPRHSHRL